jgi:uncharacterized protein with HEPN domain
VKPLRDYLLDILNYLKHLEEFTAEGVDIVYHDVKTRYAVERAYAVIGEIVKRLPDDLLDQQPQIRWRQIKGFRDVLTHQYDAIDLAFVVQALADLPTLRAAVEAMLASLPPDDVQEDEG